MLTNDLCGSVFVAYCTYEFSSLSFDRLTFRDHGWRCGGADCKPRRAAWNTRSLAHRIKCVHRIGGCLFSAIQMVAGKPKIFVYCGG